MRPILFIAISYIILGCNKKDADQPSARSLLMNHKWYNHKLMQDGASIPLHYCDTNKYLLFTDGGKGGIGNDDASCTGTGTAGLYGSFDYTFSADSNVIHMNNVPGFGNLYWKVTILNASTLEVEFTVSQPPPAYAANFDYIYTTH